MITTTLVDTHHVIETIASNLPALTGLVVRSSLVLVFAALVTSLMHRASAAARHVVWMSAIVATMAVPLLGRVAPHWDARILPASVAPTPSSVEHVAPNVIAPSVSRVPSAEQSHSATTVAPISSVVAPPLSGSAPPTAPTSTPTRPWSLSDWIAVVWLAGVIIVLARLALGTLIVWTTARRASRVDDADWLVRAHRTARELGIARPITLLASARQTVPVTWGIVYPVVLIPESAMSWEHDRREAVLVHELAHVGRLDALTQTVVQLAVAVFWFNPLVWMAAKHVRTERERACDDLVLAHGTRASFYADDLLSMVRTLTRNSEPAFAALAMARRTEFEGRMLAILDPLIDRRRLGLRGTAGALAAALAIALPLAALRPLPKTASTRSTAQMSARRGAVTSDVASSAGSGPATSAVAESASSASAMMSKSSQSCSARSGDHVLIHSDDSESTYVISHDGRCIIAQTTGKVTFSDDGTRIRSISPGGRLTISETASGTTRRYDASATSGGIAEAYYVDNRPTDVASGRTWIGHALLQLVRQDATFAKSRVAMIRARSGIAGVLTEIDSISGDYARRAYLDTLLDQGNISPDSVRVITEFGVTRLSGEYDKSEFLTHVARLPHDAATSAAMAAAARNMSSGYYKRQILTASLASRASGAGERATINRQVVVSASSITSEYDREMVLLDVLSRSRLDEDALLAVIRATEGMGSDYYHAVVLDSIAAGQAIASKAVYNALLHSADGISSSYYRAGVLTTIAARRDLTPAVAAAVLRSASTLSSDNDKANVLSAVAATPAIKDAAVRDAFFAAAKTITSGSDYRRAVSTVLP